MTNIHLDKSLTTYLKDNKITQYELSKLTNISPSTLHAYLYGSIPKSLENIIQIAHKLDMSLGELIFNQKSK